MRKYAKKMTECKMCMKDRQDDPLWHQGEVWCPHVFNLPRKAVSDHKTGLLKKKSGLMRGE